MQTTVPAAEIVADLPPHVVFSFFWGSGVSEDQTTLEGPVGRKTSEKLPHEGGSDSGEAPASGIRRGSLGVAEAGPAGLCLTTLE